MRAPVVRFRHIIFGTLFAVSAARAQKASRPEVPPAIQAPQDETVILVAHASGSQIYSCQSDMDGKFSWTLKAPEAQPKDQNGKVIGRHFAGPTWKLNDGSEVTGKAAAHVDADNPDSVPW